MKMCILTGFLNIINYSIKIFNEIFGLDHCISASSERLSKSGAKMHVMSSI
jgi:hypothetical protein